MTLMLPAFKMLLGGDAVRTAESQGPGLAETQDFVRRMIEEFGKGIQLPPSDIDWHIDEYHPADCDLSIFMNYGHPNPRFTELKVDFRQVTNIQAWQNRVRVYADRIDVRFPGYPNDSRVRTYVFLIFTTSSVAERVTKALNHLKTKCAPAKDVF